VRGATSRSPRGSHATEGPGRRRCSNGSAVAFATPAVAQDEYVVQRTVNFDLETDGKVKGHCKGEVWIGRTTSGSVQASTTVRCPSERLQLQAHLSVYAPGEFGIPFDREWGCDFCSSYSIATSEPGGPGWCAFGLADDVLVFPGNNVINYSGSAKACV
jgi:hypothetical protein